MDVVTRAEWGGPPRAWATTPVHQRVFVHHSVTSYSGGIGNIMRTLEGIAVSRGFNGVSYLHVVPAGGPDTDKIGVGRGYRKLGAHTLGYNSQYGAAWACDCSSLVPTDEAIATMANAVRLGQFYGQIVAKPPVDPHSAVYATACCGDGGRAALPEVRDRIDNGVPPGGGGFMADLSEPEQREILSAARIVKHEAGVGNPSPWLDSKLWKILPRLRDSLGIVYGHVAADDPTEPVKGDPFGQPPMRGVLAAKIDGITTGNIDSNAIAVEVVSALGPTFGASLAADLRAAINDVEVDVSIGDPS